MRRPPYGIILGLAALAAAGRMVTLWAPNVAPTFFIAFVAGVAYGVRAGALVGLLSMAVTNLLITGLHPVLLVNSATMALVGAAGGALALGVDFGQRRDAPPPLAAAVAAFAGVLVVVGFSVASDAASWALFYRNGLAGLRALVVMGLAFNLVPALVNAAVFGVATYPVLRALRKAGLLEVRRDAAAPA